MKNRIKIPVALGILCVACWGGLYFNHNIGTAKSKLEDTIRSSQKIHGDWNVKGDISDTMAAYISYPADQSDHVYSVFVNHSGLSFGYFFRGGGKLSTTSTDITEYTVEGYTDSAFISRNTKQVNKITIDDGSNLQEMNIDSNLPFAIVLPIDAGTIMFYDVNGNAVEVFEKLL